jgi:hypothetical protein
VHGRLYGGDSGDTTYHEIFVLLTKKLSKREGGVAVLLGGHEGEAVDTRIDATLHEVLEDHVRMWPAPMRAAALDRGGPAADLQLAAEQEADRRLERALRDVFARAGIGDGRGLRRPGPEIVPTTSIGVLPSFTDRRAATRRAVLGRPPIFWEAPATRCVRGRVPAPRAFVYLDVSGSMDAFLRALRPALARPVRDGAARLFAFSTEVHEVDVRTFGRKGTRSTGGTDGNAVFSHLLALPARQRPRAIVLVTDGWIGKVDATLAARLRELRIDVHVALAPDGFRKDLASLGATIHDLPAPGSAARPAGRGHRRRA